MYFLVHQGGARLHPHFKRLLVFQGEEKGSATGFGNDLKTVFLHNKISILLSIFKGFRVFGFIYKLLFSWQGWQDLNLRDDRVKVCCLTAWLQPCICTFFNRLFLKLHLTQTVSNSLSLLIKKCGLSSKHLNCCTCYFACWPLRSCRDRTFYPCRDWQHLL